MKRILYKCGYGKKLTLGCIKRIRYSTGSRFANLGLKYVFGPRHSIAQSHPHVQLPVVIMLTDNSFSGLSISGILKYNF